jgi:hypothetical protein
MPPGEEFTASLRTSGEDFVREDFCAACWNPQRESAADCVGVWKSRVPQPQEKKKLFLDNDLLVNFFERLSDAKEPARISLRFVLSLILMRKKLLSYEGTHKLPDGQDAWIMRFKGQEATHDVIDPHMDEAKIAEVSSHLGEVLEGEL